MGSPKSELFAEFTLQTLEMDTYKLDYTPHTWITYVEDIFIIWQHTDILLNKFLNQIDNLHSKINLILETELNGILPYSDVLLIKMHWVKECTFCRKPIISQSIVPHNAQVLFYYKVSTFRHFIQKAFTVSTSEHLKNEINKVYDIAIKKKKKNQSKKAP